MLKRHNEFFKSLMLIGDLFFVSASWWCAYWMRFKSNLFYAPEGYDFRDYLIAWILIVCVWTIVFRLFDFYRPRRISTHAREFVDLIKASALALLTFLGTVFIVHDLALSRIVVLVFWCASLLSVNLSHFVFREGLRFLRRRGHNLRHVLVIGTESEVQQLNQRLVWYRHIGLRVSAVHVLAGGRALDLRQSALLLKDQSEIEQVVKSGSIDQVFVTMPLQRASELAQILQWFGDEPVTAHFVPNLGALAKLRGSMEEFDGLSIMTLQSSPLYGWNSIVKRLMDVLFGLIALVLFGPAMFLIALTIKCASRGPVLYRQERMGLAAGVLRCLSFVP